MGQIEHILFIHYQNNNFSHAAAPGEVCRGRAAGVRSAEDVVQACGPQSSWCRRAARKGRGAVEEHVVHDVQAWASRGRGAVEEQTCGA